MKGSSVDLRDALVGRRRVAWQAGVMGLLTVGCAVWWLARPTSSGSFPTLALVLGLVASTLLAAVYWTRNRDVSSRVDDLILCGVSPEEEGAVVASAVNGRLAAIRSPGSRRKLAEALRRDLESAEKAAEPRTPGAPPRLVSQLDPAERRAMLDERSLLAVIADRVEQTEVDPRALILLERITEGTPHPLAANGDAGRVLARRLHQARDILAEEDGFTNRRPGERPHTIHQR